MGSYIRCRWLIRGPVRYVNKEMGTFDISECIWAAFGWECLDWA
jgi:hypothetical protein